MIITYSKTSRTSAQIGFYAVFTEEAAALALVGASAKTAGGIGAVSHQHQGAFLLGLGSRTADRSLAAKQILVAGRTFGNQIKQLEFNEVHVDLSELKSDTELLGAFARGLWLSNYVLDLWKETPGSNQADGLKIQLSGKAPVAATRLVLAKAEAIATGQRAAMHLVDRPANAKKPSDVATYVTDLGRLHGFEVEVLDEEALEIQGFGGILNVGRASVHPPRLLKLHYRGRGSGKIALVGKGITFDTGGISIKPSQNLAAMKSDLGGAAAVLGTFVSVASLQLSVELYGLLPVAENAVAGDAYLPSDVITNYGGKTIEISDTDAEGRLVLADALAYLPEWTTPDLTIDLATLTGSAVRTFGYACAALFTHTEAYITALQTAGKMTGEKVWPLPLWEEYEADLHSDVADIKHFHGKPITGAINAAKFLEYFVADKTRWIHLDIAGVAFGNNPFSKDRSATGYGVALLTQFLIDREHE